jgi:hypothetical protein
MEEEVGEMVKQKRVSVLAGRIAAGKADPISAEEREIVAGLRTLYAKRYGSNENKLVPARSGRNVRMMSSGNQSTVNPS